MSDDEADGQDDIGSSSNSPHSPSKNRSSDVTRDEEDLNVAGDGELTEVVHWSSGERR
jgi:hypothetical protein